MQRMNNCQNELLNIVREAIKLFEDKDIYLIENDLSERCICSKFAMRLESALMETPYASYCVDVEYNRGMDGSGHSLKRIGNRPILVDLIVHKRGYDCDYGFDNLICIEMKKSTNRIGCEQDEARLQKMTSTDYGFCYKLGIMLLVDMDEKHIVIHSVWSAN